MSNIEVTIHRPELTPEEREQRMEDIKRASAKLILEDEKQKASKAAESH